MILGVLEDATTNTSPPKHFFGVRVLFRKQRGEWIAFPNRCQENECLVSSPSKYPPDVFWNIGFKGRVVGTVRGRTPRTFQLHAHIGLQDVIGTKQVPHIGERSARFGGFSEDVVYRPLVANSHPYLRDPDRWTAFDPPEEFVSNVRKSFRLKYPNVCRQTADETDVEPLTYGDEDIQVVEAYASESNWRIVVLHLESAIDCDDTEAGFAMDDPLFVVTPESTVEYLASGLWLVDAGDYDDDGQSELLFAIDRYNRGGYQLFYDSFRKQVLFQFSYH